MTQAETAELLSSWDFLARDNQLPPPGDFRIWLAFCGRRYGKNRMGSEWVHKKAWENPGREGFVAARTFSDVADTVIGNAGSGIMATQYASNPCEFKRHQGSTRPKVVWANGAYARMMSSEEPDGGRGPGFYFGLADEIATWKKTKDQMGNTLWDNIAFALSGGAHPQMIAATTPRPSQLMRDLLAKAKEPGSDIHLTTGSMDDNAANLPPSLFAHIADRYGGTRLERQERFGELLSDVAGAILTLEQIDAHRVNPDCVPALARIAVGVDPAGTSKNTSDLTGINVAGKGVDGHLYSLADRSCRLSPNGWARRAIEAYYEFEADVMCPETDMGWDMVANTIRMLDDRINIKPKNTGGRNKGKRAEPILAFYEQGRAHIVGKQQGLEDELVQFTPEGWGGDHSPDHADAHVWAARELMLGAQATWDQMIAINA